MAALSLPKEEFDHLVIVDPHLKREFEEDKLNILDVKVYLRSGVVINVEVQVHISQDFRKRIAFAIGKMLAEQIKKGDEYYRIERVVNIIICCDTLLYEEPGYYNTYKLCNIRSGREFTGLVELNILEPGKLPAEPDGEKLFNWGQFFGAETPEELAMIGEKDPAIKEAAALVMELNEDDAERLRAFDRWKWQVDQAALRRDSYNNGLAEGEKRTEAKYQPELEAKDREIEELRRRLREAGLDR
jgi:predicted transposase/invertase (TIGR01784 family)